ncbi:uncharacterized protein EI97DRAFT_81250 [Westerdykella ornata]|uniref:Uncharacterized protein n=1 Tax=Westerdykella ornata TaxID=318751 RepID=A0A6A6JGW2_WESOR|nr:uncharacterized protein EI97DRAFT_81250 [Westerdykella ornata]KAF2275208.1 hypothetical protein EI97DRAFT_81250 [Westerdykella ornata]
MIAARATVVEEEGECPSAAQRLETLARRRNRSATIQPLWRPAPRPRPNVEVGATVASAAAHSGAWELREEARQGEAQEDGVVIGTSSLFLGLFKGPAGLELDLLSDWTISFIAASISVFETEPGAVQETLGAEQVTDCFSAARPWPPQPTMTSTRPLSLTQTTCKDSTMYVPAPVRARSYCLLPMPSLKMIGPASAHN